MANPILIVRKLTRKTVKIFARISPARTRNIISVFLKLAKAMKIE